MDESRKSFERWFPEMVEGMPHGMVEVFDKMLFMAWQASRAAIEIKLPTENELHQKVCSGCASDSLEMVEQAIRAAGIKVKE